MRLRLLLTLASLVALYPALARAQSSGKITGIVRAAESGRPLEGAQVLLEPIASRRAAPDATLATLRLVVLADGRYYMPGVRAGTYVLIARRIGYEAVRDTVTIAADVTLEHDLVMQSAERAAEVRDSALAVKYARATNVSPCLPEDALGRHYQSVVKEQLHLERRPAFATDRRACARIIAVMDSLRRAGGAHAARPGRHLFVFRVAGSRGREGWAAFDPVPEARTHWSPMFYFDAEFRITQVLLF